MSQMHTDPPLRLGGTEFVLMFILVRLFWVLDFAHTSCYQRQLIVLGSQQNEWWLRALRPVALVREHLHTGVWVSMASQFSLCWMRMQIAI
jgi:hypothetical protein